MKKILLSSALIAAMAATSVAGEHEWELSGVLKNETSIFLNDGNTYNGNKRDAGDLLKVENSINVFINGELTDDTALHIQGNLIHDAKGVDKFRGHRSYSQHDYLREFYIDTAFSDTPFGDWELRIGKQQVVWGTADGVKFLDIINPTDWREWGQNTMEDSRIPLWMVKAETAIGDESSLQLIWVPDLQINQISGLIDPTTGDANAPFVSLGAQTLTGKTNGFLNIARDLGKTSTVFNTLLNMGGMRGLLGPMKYRTVDFFTSLSTPGMLTDAAYKAAPKTFAQVQTSVQTAVSTLNANPAYSTSAKGAASAAELKSGFKPPINHDLQPMNSLYDANGNIDALAYIKGCFGVTPGSSSTVSLPLLNKVFIPLVSNFNAQGLIDFKGQGNGNAVLAGAANKAPELFGSFASYMTGFGPNAGTMLGQFAAAPDANKVAGLQQQGFANVDPMSLVGEVRNNMLNAVQWKTGAQGPTIGFFDDSVKAMLELGKMMLMPYNGGTDAFKQQMYSTFTGFAGQLNQLESTYNAMGAAMMAGDMATAGAKQQEMGGQMMNLVAGMLYGPAAANMNATQQAQVGRIVNAMSAQMQDPTATFTGSGATMEDAMAMQGAVDGFLANGLGSMIDPMLGMAPIFATTGTNQFDGTLSPENPTSAFDYMGDTPFGTFFYFQGMETKYRQDHANSEFKNHNLGLRFKSTAFNSLNYSLNYYYHWDNNPVIKPHWESKDGHKLSTNYVTHNAVPIQTTQTAVNAGVATAADVGNFQATDFDANGVADKVTALETMNYANGTMFTPYASKEVMDGVMQGNAASMATLQANMMTNNLANPATLVFNEYMNRVHSIGGSFDYGIDTDFAPFVLRGEFVYDKGAKQTVIDRNKLSYGDLEGTFGIEDADFIKYVIGLDVTVMTNLFTSFQFMDVWNLDYVDQKVNYNGTLHSRYTANPATMSLSNGLRKAEEHQIMYTLFLSKPFLESDALRVNNLLLIENQDGGIWNKLDAEYSWSDTVVLTAEWNHYGNDKNGVFGQFEDASNLQIGFKYIF